MENTQQIQESVQVTRLLSYFEHLLTQYEWDTNRKKTLQTMIDAIRDKQADPNLYLGIVGEFSGGKSTFINALMRDDFLKAENLQGTTTALTIFKYNAQLDLQVRYKNGRMLTYAKNSGELADAYRDFLTDQGTGPKARIRDLTQVLSSAEALSKTIGSLTVLYPSEQLKTGLVIIDTPGVQSLNERHREVTEQAIKAQSDVMLVLIQSTIPASVSLLEFLKNVRDNIGIHRCVFIVTKIDQISPGQRKGLTEMIKNKLAAELNIPAPKVIPMSALAALTEFVGAVPGSELLTETHGFEKKELANGFADGETDIYRTLNEQKLLIQLERLITLINFVFTEIKKDLEEFETKYAAENEALIKNRVGLHEDFIFERKAHYAKQIDISTKTYYDQTTECITTFWNEFLTDTKWALRMAGSIPALKTKIDGLNGDIAYKQNQLKERLSAIHQKVPQAAIHQKEVFEKEFYQLYKSLASLDGLMVHNRDSAFSAHAGGDVKSMKTTNSASYIIDRANTNETIAVRATVWTGIAIGTAIMPGVGTILGAFAGWLLSGFFGPSLDEVRAECIPKIEASINSISGQWKSAGIKVLEETIQGSKNDLNKIIDQFMTAYQAFANEMMERDARELSRLEGLRKKVKEDIRQLSLQKEAITTVKNKLLSIHQL